MIPPHSWQIVRMRRRCHSAMHGSDFGEGDTCSVQHSVRRSLLHSPRQGRFFWRPFACGHRGMVSVSVWLFGDSVVRSRPLLFVPIPSHLIPLPPSLSRHHLVLGHSILPRNSCPFFLLLFPSTTSSQPSPRLLSHRAFAFPSSSPERTLSIYALSSRPVSVCSLREHASVLSFVSPDSLHVLDSEFKK